MTFRIFGVNVWELKFIESFMKCLVGLVEHIILAHLNHKSHVLARPDVVNKIKTTVPVIGFWIGEVISQQGFKIIANIIPIQIVNKRREIQDSRPSE